MEGESCEVSFCAGRRTLAKPSAIYSQARRRFWQASKLSEASLGAGSFRKRNLLGRGKGSSFTVLLDGLFALWQRRRESILPNLTARSAIELFLPSDLEFNLLAVRCVLSGSKPNSQCGLFVVELHPYSHSQPHDARTGGTLVEGTPGSYITSRVGLREDHCPYVRAVARELRCA